MSSTVQRAAEKALTERYEALLRVSQNLISIRSSEDLFRLLARELRAVVNFYVMGVGSCRDRRCRSSSHNRFANLEKLTAVASKLSAVHIAVLDTGDNGLLEGFFEKQMA